MCPSSRFSTLLVRMCSIDANIWEGGRVERVWGRRCRIRALSRFKWNSLESWVEKRRRRAWLWYTHHLHCYGNSLERWFQQRWVELRRRRRTCPTPSPPLSLPPSHYSTNPGASDQYINKRGAQNTNNIKLDPVGSTVCYEMMKLCTGSQ